MSGTKIIDVKVVGTCSKHLKEGEEPMKDIHGNIIPDKDIECLACILESKPAETNSARFSISFKRAFNGMSMTLICAN